MNYPILLEQIDDPDFPEGYYYAHIPSVGLTTHGLGVDGARAAARDLLKIWLSEKIANGERVPSRPEFFFSTVELPDDALQTT